MQQSDSGVTRIIAGIIVEKKYGAPRNGAPVKTANGEAAGIVTSGSFSPSLDCGIALVLIDPKLAEPGTELQVEIRNKPCPTEVTSLPFYKRS